MKTSRSGIELIKRFEGCRLNAYPDPATNGEPFTIGYGITSAAGLGEIRKGMTITQAQADEWLVVALVKYEAAVMRHLKRVPTQHQFDAMVSLCYNIGVGNFKGSTVVREFNDGNIMGASLAFKMWNKGGGKIMPGLIRRREAEAQLFRTPVTKTEPPVLTDYETPTETPKGTYTMNGFKTIIVGLGMAVIPSATQYLGAIDWNTALPAPWGYIAAGAVMIAMRFVTSTPVFNK